MTAPAAHPTPTRFECLEAAGVSVQQFRFDPNARLAVHEHAKPAIVILFEGAFEASVGRRDYLCLAGDVAMIPADARHAERIGPRGAHSLVLMPTGDRFDPASGWRLPTFSVVGNARAGDCVRRLFADVCCPGVGDRLSLEQHVEEVLAHLAGAAEPDAPAAAMRRARDLLDASITRAPSLDEIARHAGLSRAQLARSFRRTFGCSVGTYLRRCRLERAARLLRETDVGISHVATMTGFYDQSHFTTAFRRWSGISPRRFRTRRRPKPADGSGTGVLALTAYVGTHASS